MELDKLCILGGYNDVIFFHIKQLNLWVFLLISEKLQNIIFIKLTCNTVMCLKTTSFI